MNSVTQDMKQFRQSLLKYSQKYGVTKAASSTKRTDNTFTAGCVGTTTLIESLRENRADRIIIRISTLSRSVEADQGSAPPQSRCGLVVLWVVLRQKRIIPRHRDRVVPAPPERRDGGQAEESKVYPKAGRGANELSR